MNKIIKVLTIWATCFSIAGLQAVPTLLNCKNSSNSINMNLVIEGVVTTVSHGKTVSDIRISTSTPYIRIMPSNASGATIAIQKSALMVVDGKYDVKIETQAIGTKNIKVEIFSANKSLGIWVFSVVG